MRGVLIVDKSSRHSKITGDFAEHLILYWLSKYGFECARVDHTGMDIIARNPKANELMGISVKGRSRSSGTEGTVLNFNKNNLEKIDIACKAFKCVPYFAFVIDEDDSIWCFIISKKHLVKIHPPGKKYVAWAMSERWIDKYRQDKNIMIVRFTHDTERWW